MSLETYSYIYVYTNATLNTVVLQIFMTRFLQQNFNIKHELYTASQLPSMKSSGCIPDCNTSTLRRM